MAGVYWLWLTQHGSPPNSKYVYWLFNYWVALLLSNKWNENKQKNEVKSFKGKTVKRFRTDCFAWFLKWVNPTDTNTHLLSFVLSLPFVFRYDQSHHLTHSSIFFMNNRLCPNVILISTCFMHIFQMLNWTVTKDML